MKSEIQHSILKLSYNTFSKLAPFATYEFMGSTPNIGGMPLFTWVLPMNSLVGLALLSRKCLDSD